MNLTHLLTIIKSLADGVDPDSKEALAEGGMLQRPHVVRALMMAAQALERMANLERKRLNRPSNAGQFWDAAEEMRLEQEFNLGIPIREIAMKLGRTPGGVATRLIKLGKVSEENVKEFLPLRREMASS